VILNRHIEFKVDLLVLSSGLIPSNNLTVLMDQFNIKLKENGFPETNFDLIETSKDGIFICGTAIKPDSITESINMAKAAAFKAIQALRR
jgi:heterodisulfide reductase subunit A-like polyferredoxin